MLNTLWNALTVGSASIGILFSLATIAFAETEVTPIPEPPNPANQLPPAKGSTGFTAKDLVSDPFSQVSSVSQLSDVKPTDWAFQALQSLVERYGCIVGYPDKTFRGNRALSRYEFAAGLNACLDRVNELIATSTADLVKKADIAILKKLQEEFAAELATLRGRVDALEARTATLEKQRFATITKLSGEVIFAIADEFNQPLNNNTTFGSRVRLNLQTSFMGTDTLNTRIAAGNANVFAIQGGSVEGIQTFNFGNTVTNSAQVDWVSYYFPIGDKIQAYVAAVGGVQYDYTNTVAGAIESYDAGTGGLSIFSQRNPIYLIGGGSGAGLTYKFNPTFAFTAGYLADNSDPTTSLTGSLNFAANRPTSKDGLFNGSYAALAQLTITPGDRLAIGLTYINAYRRFAIFDAGSALASSGTLLANGAGFGADGVTPVASTVNAYGAEFTYKFSPGFQVSGWLSYVDAKFVKLGRGDIWTYAVTLAFPDLGKKGNLGGLVFGVEPYLGNAAQLSPGAKNDVPIQLGAFYKYQLTDNISITPGVTWIISPGQNSNNSDAIIGAVRTTFTF
jgi:hypothetical protein